MRISEYRIIKQPLSDRLDHSQFDKLDIENYFAWFKEMKDDRVSYFTEFVFGKHLSEVSDTHLFGLQYLLKDSLKARSKTSQEISDEINMLPEHLKRIHEIENYVLIEPSYSIIFDIGLFWAEFLKAKFSSLDWGIEARPNMAQYGELCLNESGRKVFCPIWIVHILARQVFEGSTSEDRLQKLHSYWLNIFAKEQS
ncbi:MAG: hypothetical protein AAFR61_21050 [Bacteroidota bacterium]